jgi:hypothetical protein
MAFVNAGGGWPFPQDVRAKASDLIAIFLKVYPREGLGCTTVGRSRGAVNPKMMRKWVWLFLERITKLADHLLSFLSCHVLVNRHLTFSSSSLLSHPKLQICFESRLVNNVGNDCLMTINGTDFRILQKGVTKKGNLFGSHKYVGKSTLQYELGIDILAGNLVWIKGPYPLVHGTTSRSL